MKKKLRKQARRTKSVRVVRRKPAARRRPAPRRTVRRARKVSRKAVRRAPPRPKKVGLDPAQFWNGGDLAGFKVEIAPAVVSGGTLQRLGPPPLSGEAGEVERTLRRTYAAASALALSLARR
jgi:hypothetical protein